MRVRIHRGTREIGGNCIEVESDNKRLVLDVGRPLDADPAAEVPLPEVPGLAEVVRFVGVGDGPGRLQGEDDDDQRDLDRRDPTSGRAGTIAMDIDGGCVQMGNGHAGCAGVASGS